MIVDLHTHSNASDGELSPGELLTHAVNAGVDMLSITDHDTVAAYSAISLSPDLSLRIIAGTEISSIWRKTGIHILGLNVNPDHPVLQTGLKRQQSIREKRAEIIAEKLTRYGFANTLSGARKLAGEAPVGRPHFARYLVESGQIADEKKAFRKYLGQGKPCDIKNDWPKPDEVISWINAAGGRAVLAHPAKYKLTNFKLEELSKEFKDAGGAGLEVISGQQEPSLTYRLAKLATRTGLSASVGSDFHRPGQSWSQLGLNGILPDVCTPVWLGW